jgi:flagellar motor switch protein FliG
MLQEDMAAMGPVRLRDVDEAQGAIVALVKTLAEKNEIMLAGSDGGDEMIV